MIAAACNAAWIASALPAHRRLRRALANPAAAQRRWLAKHLRHAAGTAFAREHRLTPGTDYAEFARRVPARTYDELAPWIDRVRAGGRDVLTPGLPERLMPSSGSAAAAKLIPQTPRLRREFGAAVGAWVADLARQHPAAFAGRAYWSVTPATPTTAPPPVESAVQIGYDDDADYLGGWRAGLVRRVMAVPASAARAGDFMAATLHHLLACRDLALVSVWHPSFLALLLDRGEAEFGVRDWRAVWPRLRLVSAWGDAHAAGPLDALRRRLPWVAVQAKGLLATEGVVTIPFAGTSPAAVTSHLLEFDDGHRVRPVHRLDVGGTYNVILTTGGGLWRHRLGDRVRVVGRLDDTPTLRLIGRCDRVSDLCGEKLSEPFVGGVLRDLLPGAAFAMLAPDGGRYALFADRSLDPARLDAALQANPHYAHCRAAGQLGPAAVEVVDDPYSKYVARLRETGMRFGDIKPTPLDARPAWRAWLTGAVMTPTGFEPVAAWASGHPKGDP